MTITKIADIVNKKHIALLDTSSISFMQVLHEKGIVAEEILKEYDLVLIPEWVLTEIKDAEGRAGYLQFLIEQGYPIHSIAEEDYANLANQEEGNLYQIVYASTSKLGVIRSYLRRVVEKEDVLDMDLYQEWINKLYNEWPIQGQILSSGRIKKKNAGEVSITILAEVISWYYPETEVLTIYSQDSDTYEFQRNAENDLRKRFSTRTPIAVSYKSNDAILCQLFRNGKISVENVKKYRKDKRKLTYSKVKDDHSVILVTEVVDNALFLELVQDQSVHIIF